MKKLLTLFVFFFLSSCSLFGPKANHIDIKNDYYKIIASYPDLQSPDNQRTLKQFVLKQINQFQASYGTDEDGYRHKLKIGYKIFDSKQYKSIVFRIKVYEENILENMFFKTFVFDKHTEELIKINQILDNDLKLLVASQVLKEKLKKSIPSQYYDENRVKRALSPHFSNFSHFYFHKKDLHIIFNPLVLADFEAGHFDLILDIRPLEKPHTK